MHKARFVTATGRQRRGFVPDLADIRTLELLEALAGNDLRVAPLRVTFTL
jgi:hypothetical protein